MAPKIAGQIVGHGTDRSVSPDDLRRAFETAMSELREAHLAANKPSWYRTPIVQRGGILNASQANKEQRALADAARALAQLWKV
jgi:hypothetical protein